MPDTVTLARTRRRMALAAAALAAAPLMAACADNSTPQDGRLVVTGTDKACTASAASVPAGARTIAFKNTSGTESEIYVLRPDGSAVAERESVGPGITVTLTVELPAGSYQVRCRPGMTGEGFLTPLTVTGAAATASASADPRRDAAVAAYRTYVEAQAQSSLDGAKALAAAVTAGDIEAAKAAYAASRIGWERVEPVAESFGDLDPKIDLREADLESGQTWTGWHVLEKGLFATGSVDGLTPVAAQLVADLGTLRERVRTVEITPTGMANGAVELLDEVSKSKITGEEELFSHTDLVDIQANVAGAREVVTLLRPLLSDSGVALATTLDTRFAALQAILDTHRTGSADDAFARYDTLGADQRKALSDAVQAVSEPLSQLAAAVAR